MTKFNQNDLQEWKSNEVTKAFFHTVVDRIEDIKRELLTADDLNSILKRQGYVHALQDVLQTEVEEPQ